MTAVDSGQKIMEHGNERLVLDYHRPTTSPVEGFSEEGATNVLGELVALLRAGAPLSKPPGILVSHAGAKCSGKLGFDT